MMKRSTFLALLAAVTWMSLSPSPLLADEEQQKEDEIRESLEDAQEYFFKALKSLGEAGKKSYEEHMPEFKAQSEEALEKSQELLKRWRDQLEQELEKQKKSREKLSPSPRPQQPDEHESMPMI
ncbi:MAG: hypothetical protein HQL72_14230 [Magnetococcales bacterium]|nr:hypothetical protein [Magnetococcales bacterium]